MIFLLIICILTPYLAKVYFVALYLIQTEEEPSPPRHCNKKKRKMKHRKSKGSKKQKFTGREVEVSGTWVQCSDKECMKWRFLADITDPSHVPDVWTCEMNSGILTMINSTIAHFIHVQGYWKRTLHFCAAILVRIPTIGALMMIMITIMVMMMMIGFIWHHFKSLSLRLSTN